MADGMVSPVITTTSSHRGNEIHKDRDLSYVDFSYACLINVFFSRADLHCAKFQGRCEFTGANLRGALLAGANLQSANLQGKNLFFCIY
ncbi:Pentapeptide repeat-containing protein [Cynara cardunculus var. scolymus]|uniref:Pentapeptide repeat-containing protein n=1 Tax=Cynara cardunculus var. scolymus TaxID=59895 RepID=A0A103Y9W9_CYNCS|nr:Pentapeptide repeat-containing protein [Cynara cardunculus var. scolymus]